MTNRRAFLQSGAALTLAATLPAVHAQSAAWPQRPVRVIIPSAPGSPWDPLVRLIAERLSKDFGQPFVVENRTGATGTIGMDAVAKAADGYTLGLIFMPHVLTPSLFPKMSYDILNDVVPVTQIQWTYNALVVSPSLNVSTVSELVDLVRKNPGKYVYASGGNGTPAHILGENFSRFTGGDLMHVPYRGPVLALQDMVGGQSHISFASAAATVPHVQAGRLRVLAVSSDEPLSMLPGVPTLAQAGYPEFASREWAGIVMTKGAAPEVPQLLAEKIQAVLQDPEVVETMAQQGSYLYGAGPEALGKLMQNELIKWRELIQKLDITLG